MNWFNKGGDVQHIVRGCGEILMLATVMTNKLAASQASCDNKSGHQIKFISSRRLPIRVASAWRVAHILWRPRRIALLARGIMVQHSWPHTLQ